MIWRLRTRELNLTRRGAVMGILNVTPDSFSDGGAFGSSAEAIARGLEMREQGAAVIDVGGESTRPGAAAVPRDEEMRRVLPVIRGLIREAPDCVVSIDTSKADVAAAAVEAGAEIVNDVTGLRGDPEMGRTVADNKAAVVIMHMRGSPRTMQRNPVYAEVVEDIRKFFVERRDAALKAGIRWDRMVFDPGIGFGKTLEHNIEILRALAGLAVPPAPYLFSGSEVARPLRGRSGAEDISRHPKRARSARSTSDRSPPLFEASLEKWRTRYPAPGGEGARPLLLGVSRKSFIGSLLETDAMEARDWPTVALTSYARELGVRVVRVHDVRPNLEAMRMTEAILESGASESAKDADMR